MVVLNPLDEFEWPCTNRVSNKGFRIFHESSWTDDIGKVHTHIGQEGCLNPFEFVNNRKLILCLDGVYCIIHLHGNPIFRRTILLGDIPAFSKEFDLTLLHHPAMRKDNCISIEGRTIVEFHSLSKFECVSKTIRAYFPGGSQAWLQGSGFIFIKNESFKDIVADHKGIPICLIGGVQ